MICHALNALNRGFYVFPVEERGKRPHRAAGEWGDTATDDPNRVIAWWSAFPQANIGIACKPSALLVVDLDLPKAGYQLRNTEWGYLHDAYGPWVSGADVLDEMIYKLGGGDKEAIGRTYIVETGSGGAHLYYRWPHTWPRASQSSPVKGLVDVRNGGGQKGGYVLGEGSITLDLPQPDGTIKSGGPYRLRQDLPVALPPPWLRQLVAEKPPPVRRTPGRHGGPVNFSGLVATVANAQTGNRNNALLFAARAMCSDGATEQECIDILGPAARDAGLGDPEIGQTIRSAYRLQRRKDGL